MRRILAFAFCALLLLPSTLALFGCQAKPQEEQVLWSTLYYAYDAVEEGAEPERGEIIFSRSTAEEPFQFLRTVTVSCNTELADLYIDGVKVEGGVRRLGMAGSYEIKLCNRENEEKHTTHFIQILPDFGFVSRHIFVEYPAIHCPKNAKSITIKHEIYGTCPAGVLLKQFGKYEVTAIGNKDEEFRYVFYLRHCKSEPSVDPVTGMNALKITVGKFDGMTILAKIDGQEIEGGEYYVTRVGQHQLEAQCFLVDPATETKTAVSSLYMPAASDLLLQVKMHMDRTTGKEPYYFDLSAWDANFYLDGKPIEGKEFRVERHGAHELTICNENGEKQEGLFLVMLPGEENYKETAGIDFVFSNPHRIYSVIVLIPAALLAGFAVYLLILRRKIV